MTMTPFDFKALATIDDARVATAIDHALARIYEDMHDRPTTDKERSITLKITLAPIADDRGRLDDVDVSVKLTEKVPVRETKTYRMTARDGVLLFNEESHDNPDQGTLDIPALDATRRAAQAGE